MVGLSFLWVLAAMAPPGMTDWLFPRARHVAACVVLPLSLLSISVAVIGIRQIRERDRSDMWRRQDRGLGVTAVVISVSCALLVATSYL
ncbi:hypothetical protein ATK17_3127 [Branchiibius hedensis]|uniref:Uncharacterized protein n=1 Tax=Branchiibius hedensis TaxID=672460 RepID=A0A2Y8ZUY7_9MICO|nr:hypothetical protein ATK17_3127 [Branchiibius hedensis]SSA35755.1 hypothetical protein SAMN04489750_3127 [Branchiibius hedensis]